MRQLTLFSERPYLVTWKYGSVGVRREGERLVQWCSVSDDEGPLLHVKCTTSENHPSKQNLLDYTRVCLFKVWSQPQGSNFTEGPYEVSYLVKF